MEFEIACPNLYLQMTKRTGVWGKGRHLLAGLQVHDQGPKAGQSEIKSLFPERDHLNKAAFHLRRACMQHILFPGSLSRSQLNNLFLKTIIIKFSIIQ